MEILVALYDNCEKRITQSLKNNDIKQRPKADSGLWLGVLTSLCAIVTLLREDNSYSEICLLVGVTGFGLMVSCLCLYFCLFMEKVAIKDFQFIYFLPAIITSMLYLYIVNKGLLLSVTWGLSVVTLGTWGIPQLMSSFPSCFTVGEATAIMHSCILFLVSVVTNLPLRYHLPPIHDNDIATTLLQVGMLYVIIICLLCGCFSVLHSAKYFYALTVGTVSLFVIPLLYVILDQDPITWMFQFVFSEWSRIMLVAYWAGCLLLSVLILTYQILANSQASTSTRKHFHVLAVFVYIPGMIYDSTMLYLASGVIFALFILLELMRLLKMPPLGDILQQGFSVFADEKDNLVSLTPLYLLCGLSFPLWMPTNNLSLLPLLSGVFTVGVGDTAASFVGSKWGKHKWPGSPKSVEGTVACILSQLGLIYCLAYFGYVQDSWILFKSFFTVVGVSLVEACTTQIDNLALPLLMYLCLLI